LTKLRRFGRGSLQQNVLVYWEIRRNNSHRVDCVHKPANAKTTPETRLALEWTAMFVEVLFVPPA
jgi:hypothetical protein